MGFHTREPQVRHPPTPCGRTLAQRSRLYGCLCLAWLTYLVLFGFRNTANDPRRLSRRTASGDSGLGPQGLERLLLAPRRIWGALVRSVPPLFTPMVDVKWSGMFKPDLCICDEADRTIGVLEYESTNSSDERLVVKDLRHIEDAILAELRQGQVQTRWWLLISTLPNRRVEWPRFYDWGEDTLPLVKSRSKRDENPLAY